MGLSLLRMIPVWAWVVLAVGAWGGVQHYRAKSAAAELASVERKTAEAREQAMHGALVETTRRLTAQQGVANASDEKARKARAAAGAADAAAIRLRLYIDELSATCDSTTTSVGPAASSPGAMFADVFRRVEAAGRELAAEADRRGIAGSECSGRYDALKGSP